MNIIRSTQIPNPISIRKNYLHDFAKEEGKCWDDICKECEFDYALFKRIYNGDTTITLDDLILFHNKVGADLFALIRIIGITTPYDMYD